MAQVRQHIARQNLWMALNEAPLLHMEVASDPMSDEHFVIIKEQHIINDHIGLSLLIEELDLYLYGDSTTLPNPMPYREFIAQTQWFAEQGDTDRYFHSRLGDIEEPTLPFGLRDVQVAADQIDEANLLVDEQLSRQVRSFSQTLNVSAASVFHLAWALVVGRCSGRDDVVFGTVLSGRLQGTQGADRTLGLFINTLPLRVELLGSVQSAVESVHRDILELVKYEHASLASAQACSALPNDVPLIIAMLNQSKHNTMYLSKTIAMMME